MSLEIEFPTEHLSDAARLRQIKALLDAIGVLDVLIHRWFVGVIGRVSVDDQWRLGDGLESVSLGANRKLRTLLVQLVASDRIDGDTPLPEEIKRDPMTNAWRDELEEFSERWPIEFARFVRAEFERSVPCQPDCV